MMIDGLKFELCNAEFAKFCYTQGNEYDGDWFFTEKVCAYPEEEI